MADLFAVMNADGRVAIPAEAQTSLGLHPGSRFRLILEDDRIIFQRIALDDLEELRGILAGGPDLVEELQRERRQDKW